MSKIVNHPNCSHDDRPCPGIQRRNGKLPERKGALAVEFAMTAPLLFFLVFGILELSHANMLLNSIEAAAYEGARRGILPGATVQDCVDAAEGSLAISRVRNASVSVTPGDLDSNRAAQNVEVTITAVYGQNSLLTPRHTGSLTFVRRCRLERE